MLYRPTPPSLPPQRMSPAALATAGVLHAAVIWLLWKYSPIEPAVRYVVYQYVQPISPSPGASRAITLRPARPQASPDSQELFSRRVEPSVPLQATDQLPDTLKPAKPQPA
ncbi:hypothetical protein IM725_19550, partial [Ramlibacter aquaticus]